MKMQTNVMIPSLVVALLAILLVSQAPMVSPGSNGLVVVAVFLIGIYLGVVLTAWSNR